MALLALSHTAIEHQLYRAMLDETVAARGRVGVFGVRRLMILTGLRSYGSVRRGCLGLLNKLSIECARSDDPQQRAAYFVFRPEEIFARRRAAGVAPYPKEAQACEGNAALALAVESIVRRHDLSRREALVILCCAEGLSNAEIGEKLQISEQTVKFHLRHIFIKFGVKRRTELVSRLLTQSGPGSGPSKSSRS
jgi:DNA-binding CsgD family transcriptional regulator